MNEYERIEVLKDKINKFKEVSKLSYYDLSYLMGFSKKRINKILSNSGEEGNIDLVEKQIDIARDYSEDTIKLFEDNIHKIKTKIGKERVKNRIKEIKYNLKLQNEYIKYTNDLILECRRLAENIEKFLNQQGNIEELGLSKDRQEFKVNEYIKELEYIRNQYRLNNVEEDFKAVAENYKISISDICKLVDIAPKTYYRNWKNENKPKKNDTDDINCKNKLYKVKMMRIDRKNMRIILNKNTKVKHKTVKKINDTIECNCNINMDIHEKLYNIFEKTCETKIFTAETNNHLMDDVDTLSKR